MAYCALFTIPYTLFSSGFYNFSNTLLNHIDTLHLDFILIIDLNFLETKSFYFKLLLCVLNLKTVPVPFYSSFNK
jgi:hypothetical protein